MSDGKKSDDQGTQNVNLLGEIENDNETNILYDSDGSDELEKAKANGGDPYESTMLAKMEEANRMIEADAKSLVGLSGSLGTCGTTSSLTTESSSSQMPRVDSTSRTSSFSSQYSSLSRPRQLSFKQVGGEGDHSNPCSPSKGSVGFGLGSKTKKLLGSLIPNGRPFGTQPDFLNGLTVGPIQNGGRHDSPPSFSCNGEHASNNLFKHDQSSEYVEEFGTDTESSDWAIWSSILKDWETHSSKHMDTIRELVLKRGIPGPFRALAWQLISGAVPPTDSATSMNSVKPVYAEYLKMDSPYEKLIRRDINRTYPEHRFFKEKDSAGQESLFNVMKAYSLYDQEVGYCQGSCFIVGMLLMQMPEEEAFAVLTKIMHKYNLRKMFKPSMSDLALCMYQLESLIQDYIPDLYRHFQENNFHASLYASPWFLTLFSSSLPLDTAFRIMDVFLLDGLEVIFKVAAAILYLSKIDLVSLDMEGMLQYFHKDIPLRLGTDPEIIFHVAYHSVTDFYNEKRMRKLEKDFGTIKVKEQDELVQIKKLRQENRLLKQRVTYLEQESASLADRLIQGQVIRAEQAEEHFSVKRDFSELRKVLDDKDQSLKMALTQIQSLKKTDVERKESMTELERYNDILTTLQEELLAVKYREAECSANLLEFHKRYEALENQYRTIKVRNETDSEAHGYLQNELNVLKIRDIESCETIKQLRAKLINIEEEVNKYFAWIISAATSDKDSFIRLQTLPPPSITTRLKMPQTGNNELLQDLTVRSHDDKESLTNGSNPIPLGCLNDYMAHEFDITSNSNHVLINHHDNTFPTHGESSESTIYDLDKLSGSLCKKDRKILADLIGLSINLKLREALTYVEYKDLKIHLDEIQAQLNTKIKINEYLNDNAQYYKEKYESYVDRDTDSQSKIKRLQWELSDLQSQVQEKNLTLKLCETELMEKSIEALGAVSRLDIQNTESRLNASFNGKILSNKNTLTSPIDNNSCTIENSLLSPFSTTPSSLSSNFSTTSDINVSPNQSPTASPNLEPKSIASRSFNNHLKSHINPENCNGSNDKLLNCFPISNGNVDNPGAFDTDHPDMTYLLDQLEKSNIEQTTNNMFGIADNDTIISNLNDSKTTRKISSGNQSLHSCGDSGSIASSIAASDMANISKKVDSLINAPLSSDETDDMAQSPKTYRHP